MAEFSEGMVTLEEDELDVRWRHEDEAQETEAAHEQIDRAELARLRESQQVVERFNADPQAAMRQMAAQLGLDLVPRGGDHSGDPGATQRQPSGPVRAPAELVKEIEDQIENPEMKWMAPMLANASYAVARRQTAGLETEQRTLNARARQGEIQQAMEPLRQRVPDWHTRESEMTQMWEWFKEIANGGSLIHPRYGSFMNILYDAVTGGSRSTAQAVRRMGQAPRAQVSAPGRSGAERPDISGQIKKAGNFQDQVGIALRAAMDELGY